MLLCAEKGVATALRGGSQDGAVLDDIGGKAAFHLPSVKGLGVGGKEEFPFTFAFCWFTGGVLVEVLLNPFG